MSRLFLLALCVSLISPADKTGSMEPRPPALLGVVPAPANKGVRIHKILPESAADRAGLKVGDLILSVNSAPVRAPRELVETIQKYASGTIVAVEYERGGKTHTIQIALGTRPETQSLRGKQAPDFTLPIYGSGNKFNLQPGKVYIIDFWATWCGPCEPVRTSLEDFLHSKHSANVNVIGITTEDAATVKAFYNKRNPPYTILLDTESDVTMKYHVAGYPTLVVVDKKGIVRFAGFASNGGLEEALSAARRLALE